MKKAVFGVVILLFIILIIWFFNQRVSEGYILSVDDSRIWVLPMSDTEVEGKTEAEIISILEAKSSKSPGTFYDISLINKVLNTDFEEGQKVRIYWTGYALESAPGQIKGTLLILDAT